MGSCGRERRGAGPAGCGRSGLGPARCRRSGLGPHERAGPWGSAGESVWAGAARARACGNRACGLGPRGRERAGTSVWETSAQPFISHQLADCQEKGVSFEFHGENAKKWAFRLIRASRIARNALFLAVGSGQSGQGSRVRAVGWPAGQSGQGSRVACRVRTPRVGAPAGCCADQFLSSLKGTGKERVG